MKIEIKCNDYKTKIDVEGDVSLHEVYNGVLIHTDQGRFGVYQRDGGIEVMREGVSVYNSNSFLYKLPPPEEDKAVESPERALDAWRDYARKLQRQIAEGRSGHLFPEPSQS